MRSPLTPADTAFLAATLSMDEKRDRAAILAAWKSAHAGTVEGKPDKSLWYSIQTLWKHDDAKMYQADLRETARQATGKAVADETKDVVTLAMREQKAKKEAKVYAAELASKRLKRILDAEDDVADRLISVSALAKIAEAVNKYDVDDDEGLDPEVARTLAESVGDAVPQEPVEALTLPAPVRGKGPQQVVWPGNGGAA